MNSPNPSLGGKEFKRVVSTLRSVREDLSPENLQRFSPDVRDELEDLKERLATIDSTLNAMVDASGNMLTAKVRVVGLKEQKRLFAANGIGGGGSFATLFAGNVYRSLSFNGSRRVLSTQKNDTLLEKELSLEASSLRFSYYLNPDATQASEETVLSGYCMPLRLILGQADGEALPEVETYDEGKTWQVVLEVLDQTSALRYMVISIEFSQPLPEDWPSYEAMVRGASR